MVKRHEINVKNGLTQAQCAWLGMPLHNQYSAGEKYSFPKGNILSGSSPGDIFSGDILFRYIYPGLFCPVTFCARFNIGKDFLEFVIFRCICMSL